MLHGLLSQICVDISVRRTRPVARPCVQRCMGIARSIPALAACAVFSAALCITPLAAAAQAPLPPPPVGAAVDFGEVMTTNSSQTAFTFDRSMLSAADAFLNGKDESTRRIVAGLNSITVKTYRARDFARYDPGTLGMIDAQYRAAGWKHLVNANGAASANMTDMWLHFSGTNINGVTVLSRGDKTMSVVSVDCTLRPLDLLHLGGHFGIPKVDENAVMVPAH